MDSTIFPKEEPTPAPTCLECDDIPLDVLLRRHAIISQQNQRPETIRKVVFGGSLSLLMAYFWLLIYMQRSRRLKGGVVDVEKLDTLTILEEEEGSSLRIDVESTISELS